jgi:DNA-binding NtrC family response regulator
MAQSELHNPFNSLVGKSPELQTLLRAARIVATSDVTVLISGETGTGKELLAQALHEGSPRSEQPFVSVNCAARPEDSIETELFGFQADPLADTPDQEGLVQQAENGTLFLDEIGDLSADAQARLLQLLEHQEIQPLGAAQTRRVNVRIIGASHYPLLERVKTGAFRKDLYYRLAVVPLDLPPLRERQGDIPLLARHFVSTISTQHELEPPQLSKRALQHLERHDWQGNVRELRNLCERLCILLPGQTIQPTNLNLPEREQDSESGFRLPAGGIRLESLEKDAIHQALDLAGGNKSQAARLLGISRDTLLYRLKKYALGN